MQSLRSSSRLLATKPITIRLSSKFSRGSMAALITVLVLLTGQIQLYAQSRTATTSLELRVNPEELLQVQNESVLLKIRLGSRTIASIWAANSCTSPAPQSQVITASGTYTVPLHTLMSGIGNPDSNAARVCLISSDGALKDSAPVGIFATGNGAAMQGRTPQLAPNGVSVVVQDGWAVTTQAGTATWSNP
jgi:hypothetical protein